MPGLAAAIADIGGLLNLPAVFPLKTWADIIAAVAGTAEGITDDQFAAGVCLLAAKTMNTEVIRVVKAPSVPGIDDPMFPDFFGDGGRVLAEIPCDFTEGLTGIEGLFNKSTVIERKMFVVTRD